MVWVEESLLLHILKLH